MAGPDDTISSLQNIARQIGIYAASIANTNPAATTAVSPVFTGVAISTVASVIIAASTSRHGIMFHNPGTSSGYLFPSNITTAPTTTSLGGSIVVYPGGTLQLMASQYPNVTTGWSAFSGTGSSQPFTVVEFF